ncbi:hypothetical protein Vqi01_56670 [Micromonospora qiuiae]|uniref:DUF6966 domain-containing protein n=1 Tax=Micromonospora qiuiae TaxID=502268 RepID=A0ABQ4JIS9_9ACTN|nr:hypothetical protein [Micromonospora qiuiae]GIJ30505.1 hypothetical protein Vqi01_56670 [Micromonospora qiuiae]
MTAAEDSEFRIRLRELTTALEEMEDLLRNNNAEGWAEWVGRVLAGLNRHDADALDHLLGPYRGGMGSFNDLVLGDWTWPVGPVPVAIRQANDRLSELRERCYSLAIHLRGRP